MNFIVANFMLGLLYLKPDSTQRCLFALSSVQRIKKSFVKTNLVIPPVPVLSERKKKIGERNRYCSQAVLFAGGIHRHRCPRCHHHHHCRPHLCDHHLVGRQMNSQIFQKNKRN